MAILNFGMEGALTSMYIRPEAAPGKRKRIKNKIPILINEKWAIPFLGKLSKIHIHGIIHLKIL